MRTPKPVGPIVLLCVVLCAGALSSAHARKEKKPKEAVEAEPAVVDSAEQAKKHLSFGHRYLKSKQYEDAEVQLRKSLDYDPKRGAAYYLGKLCNETDRLDEAAAWFEKGIALTPDSKNTKNAYYFLATIYELQGQSDQAIQAYEALLGFSPDRDREVQYLHHLVSLYVDAGDYEKALEYARRWGEFEPDNAEVQDMVAKLALSTGEEDEALTKMEQVMGMNPDDYATLDRLADMYRDRAQVEKAFEAYERLHASAPKNFLYLEHLHELGQQVSKPERFQVQTLRKMIKLQPKNLRVIELLADATGSIEMINRGLKLDTGNGKLNYMKGDWYYEKWKKSFSKKDSVRALRWFEKAKIDPQWCGNAKRMIDEINPPLTEEEKKLQKFFKKNKKKEEVDIKGKK